MASSAEPGAQPLTSGSRSTSPEDDPGSTLQRALVERAADAALGEVALRRLPRQYVPPTSAQGSSAQAPKASLSAIVSFTLGAVALALSVIPGLESHAIAPAFGGLALGIPTYVAAHHGKRPGCWMALAAVLLSTVSLAAVASVELLAS